MKLIIVESPTKAKTISKFLEGEYKVESSFGHIRDLPRSKLGIDIEHNFEPQYVIPRKASKLVSELKKLAEKSSEVILATDADREGEAIAWHLLSALKLEDKQEKTERIVFHEITKNAIEEALKHPRKIDMDLVDAQQGRRILDRLVGYKLSPFLWKKIFKGLSAGRVQSVALRIIVEREEEIAKFVPVEYWQLEAILNKQNDKKEIESRLIKIGEEPLSQLSLKTKNEVDSIINELKSADYIVSGKEVKETKKNPLAPFTTSTLQQESSHRLGYSAKKTMMLAQRLYENGLITYMRTDSVNLSNDSLAAAKIWISQNLGEQYATQAPRTFKTKSRLAQEAHEAVRPTDVNKTPQTFKLDDAGENKLYSLIWQRFMASQMPQAIFEATQVDINANNFTFRTNGNVMKFDGYLKVWGQKFEAKELPPIAVGEKLNLKELKPSQHFTEPPPRYNEASLIKLLEEYGIGRPSTYAPTLSTIQARFYVEKITGRLQPTDTGKLVNKVLVENFPEIVDINFTAKMEEDLDSIAEKKSKWQDVIREFYEPFAKNLEQKYVDAPSEKPPEEKTDEVCDKCGKPMVIKTGRFGRFLACSGFPDCKNAKPITPAAKKTGLKCPKCLEDSERKNAPGEIIEKRVSRGRARGKIFWGCSCYPACDHAVWENPLKPKIEEEATTEIKENAEVKENTETKKEDNK